MIFHTWLYVGNRSGRGDLKTDAIDCPQAGRDRSEPYLRFMYGVTQPIEKLGCPCCDLERCNVMKKTS